MAFSGGRVRVGFDRASARGAWSGGHLALAPLSGGGASLSLGGGGLELSAFASVPRPNFESARPTRAAGAQLAWHPAGAALGLRLGALHEFGGAFGRFDSGLAFAGAGFRAGLGGWRLAADAELGVARPRAAGGLAHAFSPLVTSAFSFAAERPLDGAGRLRLSLSQPLRIESGELRLRIPVGRTRGGGVVRETVAAPLAPSGRQTDLAAAWYGPADSAGGRPRLGATLSLQPRHTAGNADLTLLAGYRLAF